MEVVASLSQGRTAAAQWGLFTHKSVPVIFEPPCIRTTMKTANTGEVAPSHLRCYDLCKGVPNELMKARRSSQ